MDLTCRIQIYHKNLIIKYRSVFFNTDRFFKHWLVFSKLWKNFCKVCDAVVAKGGVYVIEWPQRCLYWYDRRAISYLKKLECELLYLGFKLSAIYHDKYKLRLRFTPKMSSLMLRLRMESEHALPCLPS